MMWNCLRTLGQRVHVEYRPDFDPALFYYHDPDCIRLGVHRFRAVIDVIHPRI
jgi:hypothetical protein